MSIAIINNNNKYNDEYSLENKNLSALDAHRRQIIKRKVLAIGKLSRNYTVLKENPQLIQQLKSLSPNGKLCAGTLASGEQGIREAIIQKSANFDLNKLKDQKDRKLYGSQSNSNYKAASK